MKERHRIPGTTAFLMLSVAVFIDIFQFFLDLTVFFALLAPVMAGIGWFTLWFWFKLRGVTFSDNSQRMTVNFLMGVLELVPFVDALPGLTFGTWLTIRSVQAEDKKRNDSLKQKQSTEKSAPNRLSQSGENKNQATYYNRGTANNNTPERKVA